MSKSGGRPGKPSLVSTVQGTGSHVSVTTRRIANGYVVTQGTDTGQTYESTETFYPSEPSIGVSIAPPSNVGLGNTGKVTSSLATAVGLISQPFSDQGKK